MKVKCVVNCDGVGYEKFIAGEERDIEKQTAKTLVEFGYAIASKPKNPKSDNAEGGG